ncbi:hypothetical protein, partial [Streptomyces sp. NPDC056670]|uniref:hypothetical protein n=1 Tax=Streptomyces sp. NPDC056670 TaxID=3345904 RepID=UPI0036ABFF4A
YNEFYGEVPELTVSLTTVPDPAKIQFNTGRLHVELLPLGPERTGAVQAAWAAVREQRARYSDFPDHRVMLWEMQRPVRAVSLALESAGLQPSAVDEYGSCVRDGYKVDASNSRLTARVTMAFPSSWTTVGSPERRESSALHHINDGALAQYSAALEQRGWLCTKHRSPHSAYGYLIVIPRRA